MDHLVCHVSSKGSTIPSGSDILAISRSSSSARANSPSYQHTKLRRNTQYPRVEFKSDIQLHVRFMLFTFSRPEQKPSTISTVTFGRDQPFTLQRSSLDKPHLYFRLLDRYQHQFLTHIRLHFGSSRFSATHWDRSASSILS